MVIASAAESAASALAAAVGLLTLVWVASLIRRDASLVDRFWGLGFVVLAWLYWKTGPSLPDGRVAWPAVAMVTVWGIRLSAYLTWRNYGHGEDYRYQAMRTRQGQTFAVLVAVRTGVELGEPPAWAGAARAETGCNQAAVSRLGGANQSILPNNDLLG